MHFPSYWSVASLPINGTAVLLTHYTPYVPQCLIPCSSFLNHGKPLSTLPSYPNLEEPPPPVPSRLYRRKPLSPLPSRLHHVNSLSPPSSLLLSYSCTPAHKQCASSLLLSYSCTPAHKQCEITNRKKYYYNTTAVAK
ncbi:unnamed protein product, partial [Laminaria digitata]